VCDYDIVYMTGGFGIPWNPRDMSLGGSEQAIVNLSKEWVKLGKKVAVYCDLTNHTPVTSGINPNTPDMTVDGVDYYNWRKFPYSAKLKTLIVWRGFGVMSTLPFDIKADRIWVDLHDNFYGDQLLNNWKKYGTKVDKVFFKSNYHKEAFEKYISQTLDVNKYAIIPNGVRVDDFLVNKYNEKRNPFRFCYCSCYTRGLIEILQHFWPVIYSIEPRAELHVYYGMNGIKDKELISHLTYLLAQPGVMDHGRQPMEMIIREKYLSSFHLYLTDTIAEIDCISIRESLATGAIPLISNFGVFKDRAGIHYDIERKNPDSYRRAAFNLITLIEDTEKLDKIRETNKKSDLLINWTDVSKKWLDICEC
jgi:hypothetical protein